MARVCLKTERESRKRAAAPGDTWTEAFGKSRQYKYRAALETTVKQMMAMESGPKSMVSEWVANT